MIFVIDASVAIKWFIREALHDEAVELLARPSELYSIDLLVSEVSNIASKKATRGEINAPQAIEIAKTIRQGIPVLYPTGLFNERALDLALALQHSVYDCLYLACAEAMEGVLITADIQFLRKAHKAGFEKQVYQLGSNQISALNPK